MNYLPIALLVTAGLVASTAVHAQEVSADAPVRSQSATLVTEPASVNAPVYSTGYQRTTPLYTPERLNGVAGSFQVRPKNQGSSIIPASVSNKLAPPPSAPSSVDPLDFFRVPRLDGGVRVKVD